MVVTVRASERTRSYDLDPATIASIYHHARSAYPRECCGFLQCAPDQATELVVCDNVQDKLHALDPIEHPRTAETAYSLGGGQLLRLVRSFDTQHPALMIYHSHPRGGAYFSEMDIRAALAVDYPVDYLVVDVGDTAIQCARIFRRRGSSDAFNELVYLDGARI